MLFRRKGGAQTPRGRIATGIIWLILFVPIILFTLRARNWLFGAILAAVIYLIIRYTLEEVSPYREERKSRNEEPGKEDVTREPEE